VSENKTRHGGRDIRRLMNVWSEYYIEGGRWLVETACKVEIVSEVNHDHGWQGKSL
jgi:hypothetical protein